MQSNLATVIEELGPKPPVYVPYKNYCQDMYQAYVAKLLKEHPEYWTRYDKRMSHYWVYRKGKVAGKNIVETVISYGQFREIIETYYLIAGDYIIQGGTLNLGANLGSIEARRVERNFSNPVVNQWETMKQPKDPITGRPVKIIYYDDDDWIRIGWIKSGKITNYMVYDFCPAPKNATGGGKGLKYRFSQANIMNPLLKFRYTFYPFIPEETVPFKRYK